MTKITVLTTDINVVSINNEDYICITDMLKSQRWRFLHIRLAKKQEYTGIPRYMGAVV